MTWETVIFDSSNNIVTPTPEGWVLSAGFYNGTIPIPNGGNIIFTITVVPEELDGLKVRMVPVGMTGNRFQQATDGHYQIPIGEVFEWAQEWTRDGKIVSQTRYSAYANTISGSSNIEWTTYGQRCNVVSTSTFAVQVYDNQQTGPNSTSVTVDAVTIDFYYVQ